MKLRSTVCRAFSFWTAWALLPLSALAEPSPTPPVSLSLEDPPIAGDKDGLIYLRDPYDYIRLYPHARVALDAHFFFGDGVQDLPADTAGVELGPRFFVREARLALGGEIAQRVGFDVGVDFVANPAIDGTRVDGRHTLIALSNAWVALQAGRGFELTLGYVEAPFSLENRTGKFDLPQLERNIAIRGFVVPAPGKVLGAAVSGVTVHARLHWNCGVFGDESFAPGDLDRSFQLMCRFGSRPFAKHRSSVFREFQFGVSGRYGSRNYRDTYADLPAITSGQGFAMFRPTLRDGDQTVHIIPTDEQYAFGTEVRFPFHNIVVRAEAYWVHRNTLEATDPGRSDAIRRGSVEGLGWYVEVSTWLLQLLRAIDGDPPRFGEHPHVQHLEVAQLPATVDRYGFELAFIAAGVNGSYDGSSRKGPKPEGARAEDLEVYQFGAAINFWQTKRLRLSVGYAFYWAPHSGSLKNLAVVPGNLGDMPDAGADSLHELTGRAMVMF